jgi:hypothetical protein
VAQQWLADRQADLLPVEYYHLTLPAQIADIAYQNKAVIYDLLFKATAETLTTIAADPKRHDPSSASALHCPRWGLVPRGLGSL